jgi:hypothetical protein
MLAVDGLTSATTANSVLVRALPSKRQKRIRARAGTPMADAMSETAREAGRASLDRVRAGDGMAEF